MDLFVFEIPRFLLNVLTLNWGLLIGDWTTVRRELGGEEMVSEGIQRDFFL